MTMAKEINNHLLNGGIVVISTYNKSFQYESKHTGWFTIGNNGNLYVKSGKNKNCLTSNNGKMLLVKIRLYD